MGLVRLAYTTTCLDIGEIDFMVRTECAAFWRGNRICVVWVADSTQDVILARVVDRAVSGDAKNDPQRIARRIVQAQREQARELLLLKLRR